MPELVLHDEMRILLCDAACRWAGLPQDMRGVLRRTQEFGAMIDGAGAVGPRNYWARLLRRRSERWAQDALAALRDEGEPEEGASPAAALLAHRDPEGRPLPLEVAAVELLNLLRPTVAIARYATFAALALHERPHAAEAIRGGSAAHLEHFVQEVRRFYPFFPFVGGRVRQPFVWQGRDFREGEWVLLDLYGTNRDPRLWHRPDEFRPERFVTERIDPWNLVPQGAGDHFHGHRCPGEWATIALTGLLARLLAVELRYEVPEQDLRIRLNRMPALPASGFVLARVRRVAESTGEAGGAA